MLVPILQIIMCLFIIASCVYSIFCENKRGKQMDEALKNIKKKYPRDFEND